MPSPAATPNVTEMVDLFAGPGGLDVAATWLGITSVGIEIDENACATRASANLCTDRADVRLRGPHDYPDARVLVGGPPCQTYSVAGSGAGRDRLNEVVDFIDRMALYGPNDVVQDLAELDDERTGLVLEPLRWVLEAKQRDAPYEVVVLEQVPTVLPLWRKYAEVLTDMGYCADARVLRAEEFGVPQTRRRAMLIALRGREIQWPETTHRRFPHGTGKPTDEQKRNWVSMSEALGRRGKFVVVSNYGTGGRPEVRGERRYDQPAYTVTGKVSRNRILNGRGKYIAHIETVDASRLQTFPAGYPWSGKDVAQQIGNAIPPRLAAHVLGMAVFGAQPSEALLDNAVKGRWQPASVGCLRPHEPVPDVVGEPLALFDPPEPVMSPVG